jgi:aminoglycoside phosphotransferase (APT) family kinase protein
MEKTVALSEDELGLKDALNSYISAHGLPIQTIENISRFPGGYSNLTYCLSTKEKEYVLRTPPHGANIKSAHDMGREFKVLSLLKPHFDQVPTTIDFCEDITIIGAPFYLMEKLEGRILRAYNAPKMQLPAATFTSLSEQLIDTLVALHSIDISTTNLDQLGKPDGYVQRQVEGWIKRYYVAETDAIENMNQVAKWLQSFRPIEQAPAFLHNDFKYDNVIFSSDFTKVVGVLDWEMSTVGNPLMDLGAMLAYWFEEGEGDVFKQYNLSWLPGNYTRQELLNRYAAKSGRDLSDMHFYYVFGLFKNAVIAQQIYHRFKQGHSSDARFGALLPMIRLLSERAAAEMQ